MATRAKRPVTKKKDAQSRPLGTVIAERSLTIVGQGDSLARIRVGKPRKDRATNDYFCPFILLGVGEQKVRQAWGIDSMQALQNALQAIRIELASHADDLRWEGGQDGWLGFSQTLPDLFGPKFTRRLERLVGRETDRFARTLEAANQPIKRLVGGKRVTITKSRH
ncbi:DUF6968 family protein [Archangium lipolyticum]|uniref:DUF6968 family protein n=1 Tax=Archangium lipolyticum TaxID=2970465 RepID=UPI00214A3A23|nr:hypothetical protein [Archangium lipolyticum]